MLGKLSGEEETNSSLDLSGGDGVTLVVVSETIGLRSQTLEDIVDEGVHDCHSLVRDTSIRMDLLEDLVDEGRVRRIISAGLAFTAALRSLHYFLLGLFAAFLAFTTGHVESGSRETDGEGVEIPLYGMLAAGWSVSSASSPCEVSPVGMSLFGLSSVMTRFCAFLRFRHFSPPLRCVLLL